MSPEQICRMAASGNKDAERFCVAWLEFCHLVDDCADRDKPIDDNRLARVFTNYTLELCGNPFFQAHKGQLVSLMVQGANAWVDSNRATYPKSWEETEPGVMSGTYSDEEKQLLPQRQAQRDVLKGFYHEVIFHVAFICGGWPHLRRVTSECREYDFESLKGGT